MRKNAFPRYFRYLFLYCVVFVLLVVIQFSRKGNFSHRIGDIQINGRYSLEINSSEKERENAGLPQIDLRLLDGSASVFFGGLEFRLASQTGSKQADIQGVKGFSLVDFEGNNRQVLPEYIAFQENEAVFYLPGGTALSFTNIYSPGINATTTSDGGRSSGIRISGKFADGISGIIIPFKPQRSSITLHNGENGLNISYNGSRYGFNRTLPGIESGRLILSDTVSSVSYQILTEKKEINPEDFFIPQTETSEIFAEALSKWTGENFVLWRQNMSVRTDQDTVIAWCAEALSRGGYGSAAAAVPISFSTDPGRTWESAVYQFDRRIGNWERGARASVVFEREKTNRISQMLQEEDIGVFAENKLFEYFSVRGLNHLTDEAVLFAAGLDPSDITLEICPGIFESFTETDRLRPDIVNPFEPLAEKACLIVAEGLKSDKGRVFVFSDNEADMELNIRIGTALEEWANKSVRENWARLARSLVLSVISSVSDEGTAPKSMTIGPDGEFSPSEERIGSAKLYRLFKRDEYAPRAIATGVNGIWAWTAASSVRITRNAREMVISTEFLTGETHYVMLNNVDPFPLLQINQTNWRRAGDFEGYYNSSGWNYFERDRVLVLKLRHRIPVEQVRILFVAPPPPPPPPPPQEAAPQEE